MRIRWSGPQVSVPDADGMSTSRTPKLTTNRLTDYYTTMPTAADRPYTFRASPDLGERIRDASEFLDEIAEAAGGGDIAERVASELVLALMRDRQRFHGIGGNQSAFMRETVDLVVRAAQKVASDLRFADAYAEAAASQSADEREFRRGTRAVASRRLRDL